ncbi:endonuclease V-like [Salvelinus alpinus]
MHQQDSPTTRRSLLYEDSQMVTLTAPYISGFLAFRETPYLLEALQRLETTQLSLLPQLATSACYLYLSLLPQPATSACYLYLSLLPLPQPATSACYLYLSLLPQPATSACYLYLSLLPLPQPATSACYLSLLPQVVLVDGNGLFHYREFGLVCHLGVLSGLSCIGVANNLLQVQGVEKNLLQIASLQNGGDSFPLTTDSGKVLGRALRSPDSSTKPVYVSVGHKISLDTDLRLTHSCYRVPEPIRQADMRSREYLRVHFPTAADT